MLGRCLSPYRRLSRVAARTGCQLLPAVAITDRRNRVRVVRVQSVCDTRSGSSWPRYCWPLPRARHRRRQQPQVPPPHLPRQRVVARFLVRPQSLPPRSRWHRPPSFSHRRRAPSLRHRRRRQLLARFPRPARRRRRDWPVRPRLPLPPSAAVQHHPRAHRPEPPRRPRLPRPWHPRQRFPPATP
jgi:hypothetical protein